MRLTRVRVLLATAVLLAGCPGAVPAPADLVAVQLSSIDNVQLEWTRPSTQVDGYEVQGQLSGGDWTSAEGLVPGDAAAVALSLDPGLPERINIGFRIRSVLGGTHSDWVTATFRRGIRGPPTLTVDSTRTGPGVLVPPVTATWQNASQVATELRLERALSQPGTPSFVPVSGVAFPATSASDSAVTQGTWQYRISYGTQGEWSLPTLSNPVTVDISPPTGLTVHQVDGGVELDWTAPGTGQQGIERYDPGQPNFGGTSVATLPGTANTYLDPIAAPWPAATYSLSVSNGVAGVSTPEVAIGTVKVSGPVQLTGTAWTLPGTTHLVRTEQGLVHGADYGPNTTTLYRDTGAGWESHPTSSPLFEFGGLFADGAGHPHAVYTDSYADQPATRVVHEWHDGSAWRSETVSVMPASLLQAAVTSDATVHVLTQRREPSGQYTPVYVVGSGGSFTPKDLVPSVLPPPTPPNVWGCLDPRMDVGSDGTAWVLLTCGDTPTVNTSFVLFRRSAAGVWSEELLPFGGTGLTALVIGGPGASAAVMEGPLEGGVMDRVVHVRSASGWGAAERLPSTLDSMNWRGALMSTDGARIVAVLYDYPDAVDLAVRAPGGWTSMQLGSPCIVTDGIVRLGQTAAGALVVTVPGAEPAAGRPNASIYVETP